MLPNAMLNNILFSVQIFVWVKFGYVKGSLPEMPAEQTDLILTPEHKSASTVSYDCE